MQIRSRAGAALGLGLMLAGCGEPTIEWQRAESPDHRYVATAEYDAPVLDHKDTYVFLASGAFSRGVVYRTHMHDCLVLHWTGPRTLMIDHLGGAPSVMKSRWQPLFGGDPVTITYRGIIISGMTIPAPCMAAR